jgi:hypothetical protein
MAGRLNQSQLKKELGLTDEAIDNIRELNIIRWSKSGKQIYFDRDAVEIFKKSFDIRDHLTISECAKKLKKYDLYSEPQSSGKKKKGGGRKSPKSYATSLGPDIYITVKTLIKGSNDTLQDGRKFLPDDYRLEVRELGKTIYIPRDSFAKTLKWLFKLKPRSDEWLRKQTDEWHDNQRDNDEIQWVNVKPKKKKKQSRKKGIRGLKTIKTARKIVGK